MGLPRKHRTGTAFIIDKQPKKFYPLMTDHNGKVIKGEGFSSPEELFSKIPEEQKRDLSNRNMYRLFDKPLKSFQPLIAKKTGEATPQVTTKSGGGESKGKGSPARYIDYRPFRIEDISKDKTAPQGKFKELLSNKKKGKGRGKPKGLLLESENQKGLIY